MFSSFIYIAIALISFFIILSLFSTSSLFNKYTNSLYCFILSIMFDILSRLISSIFTKSDTSFSCCSACKLNLSINLLKSEFETDSKGVKEEYL